MVIPFRKIQHLIPFQVFNDFGQLTGQYVFGDKIVCESDGGRIRIWLNKEAYEQKDPDRLICDYDEEELNLFNGGSK